MRKAWNAVHFVRFDFKINAGNLKFDNAHLWDRKDGRYRIERTGKQEVDLFTIADYERDKSGSVYVNGKNARGLTRRTSTWPMRAVPTSTIRGGCACPGSGWPPEPT